MVSSGRLNVQLPCQQQAARNNKPLFWCTCSSRTDLHYQGDCSDREQVEKPCGGRKPKTLLLSGAFLANATMHATMQTKNRNNPRPSLNAPRPFRRRLLRLPCVTVSPAPAPPPPPPTLHGGADGAPYQEWGYLSRRKDCCVGSPQTSMLPSLATAVSIQVNLRIYLLAVAATEGVDFSGHRELVFLLIWFGRGGD